MTINDMANPEYSSVLEVAKGDPSKKKVVKSVAEAVCTDAKEVSFKKCSKQAS